MQITPTLKVGQPDDIPQLPPLLKEFFKMSPFTEYTLDLPKVMDALPKMAVDRQNSIVLLSTDGEKVVGLIVGQRVIPTFSNDPVALELAWYLQPDYRRSRRAVEMLDAFEAWAKMVGCKFVQYSILKGTEEADDHDVSKIYKMRGFKLTEQGFQKRII